MPFYPRFGLGLAALGRPGYINLGHAADLSAGHDPDAMRRNAHAVLDAAHDAGVRYFDAARSYGRAEEFLADWLDRRNLAPNEVFVASKWGYTYTADWRIDADKHEVKDHGADTFRRQLEESKTLLGKYLRLYQIHSATLDSGVLDDAEVVRGLRNLRESGIQIGLSVTGPRQADTLRKALSLDLFDAVQATWNLLERSVGDALAKAKAAGLRVIVKESLANGRLTARAPIVPLQEQAARLGCTVDALALAGVLARPWVDVVLSGATTPEQLRSNLAATEVRWDAECERALAGIAEEPEAYWRKRAGLVWN
jgi:aryl-alcohol dehydrogenase-like predicted oxidoreductase